ncbi:hypothetical protein [Streptomyces avermitilis]|uniref:hypothetical protein n=1 Tax=Streptomyces avermitilis TaxID=33903 RepID=UPI003F541B9B
MTPGRAGRVCRSVDRAGAACPALVLRLDGAIDAVVAVRIDDGLIAGFCAVRNAAKLSHMQRAAALRR